MLSFQPITTTATPEFDLVWQLYIQSFPPEERRNLEQMQGLLPCHGYHFWGILFSNEFQGFLGFWQLPRFAFLEHFAVVPAVRGKGMGSRALKAWMKEVNQPIVLEVEPPVTEMAQRRIEFYQRAGFHLNSFPYQQPPYDVHKPWVPLQVMSYPAQLDLQEFEEVVQVLYQKVYNVYG